MTIKLNSDHNLRVHKEFREQLNSLISEELGRFRGHITRLEVHLSDEKGHNEALTDKRCVIEACLEGKKPILVTYIANNHNQAVEGAIEKLNTSLDTIFDRLNSHQNLITPTLTLQF